MHPVGKSFCTTQHQHILDIAIYMFVQSHMPQMLPPRCCQHHAAAQTGHTVRKCLCAQLHPMFLDCYSVLCCAACCRATAFTHSHRPRVACTSALVCSLDVCSSVIESADLRKLLAYSRPRAQPSAAAALCHVRCCNAPLTAAKVLYAVADAALHDARCDLQIDPGALAQLCSCHRVVPLLGQPHKIGMTTGACCKVWAMERFNIIEDVARRTQVADAACMEAPA